MRAGDPSSGAARLLDALDVMQLRWEETKAHWHDQVQIDFERQYLEEVPPRVQALIERINSLSQMLVKARHECADSDD